MATHSVQSTTTNDSSAWPSRYYGKTRHIDLEKIYHDIVAQSSSSQTTDKKTHRQVSFSNDAPIVHEYEPEYDEDDEDNHYDDAPPQYFPTVFVANTPDYDRDTEASSVVYRKKKRASVRRLDLRPIQNPEYRKTATPTLVKDDDDSASVSSAEPITPEATTVPPMPERTCSSCSCPQPASLQKQQTRRITINRIRSTSWIPKSIQNIL